MEGDLKIYILAATLALFPAGLLSAAAPASAANAGAARVGTTSGIHVYHFENVLGTSLDMKLRAASDGDAERAQAAALKEFDRENRILSGWTADSEFSRWAKTRGTAQHVSPELFEVLALFDAWREKTDGALDASAEAAVEAWKQAAAEGRKPTDAELAHAVEVMQRPHWKLDAKTGTAMHLDDAPIALNSFAKSYITGHAADAALAAGATGVVLNVGGDIVLRGDVTERVAIANPRADAENDPPVDMVRLSGAAIATSGSYRRGVDVGGVHYSHIVDPRTGIAVDHVLSSTVIAADPAEAGALATAFSVMTPAESARLANRLDGVEYLLMLRDGRRIASPGWYRLETPRVVAASYSPRRPASAKAALKTPAAPLDLLITLELARSDAWRYRRPYVAVWVEDAQGAPVRAISLWSEKPRYLNELRRWYHDYPSSRQYGAELSPSVSSATRPPGKYTLRWDGTDDKGNPVKPGRYTILVEAAREHGGYDLMHHEISFDGETPAQSSLPAGNEIAGVQLDYGKHTE
jgi:thiamine biosynthesis lipoprotein ApbE